jgi:hypothetical protein
MNIFEGARRIALLVAGLSILCAGVAIYETEPFVEIKYRVSFFGLPPARSSQCDTVDATHSVKHKTPEGHKFNVEMCFAASRADNGKMLIPYGEAPNGRYYMSSEYSDKVSEYMAFITEVKFTPTAIDMQDAEKEFLRQAVMKRLAGFGWLVVGLAAFWAFVCVIGWIARGFAGIPSGQDRKIAHRPGG